MHLSGLYQPGWWVGSPGAGIENLFFSPRLNIIISIFKDIHFWPPPLKICLTLKYNHSSTRLQFIYFRSLTMKLAGLGDMMSSQLINFMFFLISCSSLSVSLIYSEIGRRGKNQYSELRQDIWEKILAWPGSCLNFYSEFSHIIN